MEELTYTQAGDYFIPNIRLAEFDGEIGHYGRMRRAYLQEHNPGLFSHLILTEQLFSHLQEVDQAAHRRMEVMLPQLKYQRGITEELKAADQLRWVQEMNVIREIVEEIIRIELICV